MIIKNKITLGKTNLYISCDCEYKKKDGITQLCLRNYSKDYFDGGDLSLLIERLEKNYNRDDCKKYDGNDWFLSKCLYIYENIPFISGVGDFYVDHDNVIYSLSYITKEELDAYIKENNIILKDNTNFKLWDGRTWLIGDEDE